MRWCIGFRALLFGLLMLSVLLVVGWVLLFGERAWVGLWCGVNSVVVSFSLV